MAAVDTLSLLSNVLKPNTMSVTTAKCRGNKKSYYTNFNSIICHEDVWKMSIELYKEVCVHFSRAAFNHLQSSKMALSK